MLIADVDLKRLSNLFSDYTELSLQDLLLSIRSVSSETMNSRSSELPWGCATGITAS